MGIPGPFSESLGCAGPRETRQRTLQLGMVREAVTMLSTDSRDLSSLSASRPAEAWGPSRSNVLMFLLFPQGTECSASKLLVPEPVLVLTCTPGTPPAAVGSIPAWANPQALGLILANKPVSCPLGPISGLQSPPGPTSGAVLGLRFCPSPQSRVYALFQLTVLAVPAIYDINTFVCLLQ